jgi:hypothetical protein
MPQGVKSNLSDAEKYEKHLKRCIEYKKNKRLNDPEFVKKEKEYNTQYQARLREAGIKARLEKKIANEQK